MEGMDDDSEFIEVRVEALTLSKIGFVLLLRPDGGDRALPIFIGAPEAHSIAIALSDEEFPRPLTHDLFRAALEELGAQVVRVRIVDLEDQTFHARLFVEGSTGEFELDARPSDAIALALRFEAPIEVASEVWEQASAPIEVEGETEKQPDPRTQLQKRLDEAVRSEHFEEAARLRDELRRLGTGN